MIINEDIKVYFFLSDSDYIRAAIKFRKHTKKVYNTGIYCPRDEFSEGMVRPRTIKGKQAFQQISDFISRVEKIRTHYYYTSEIIVNILRGEYKEETHAFTLMNAINYSMENLHCSPKTREDYECIVKSFEEFLLYEMGYEDVAAPKISPSITERYKKVMLDDGLKAMTVKRKLNVLAKLYDDFVIDHDQIIEFAPKNPFRVSSSRMRGLVRKDIKTRRERVRNFNLSEKQVEKIKNLEIKDPSKHHMRQTALWQIYTGFSFDDLLHYNWRVKSTDSGRYILMIRGKSGNDCVIPMIPELEELHQEMIDMYGDEMFPFSRDKAKDTNRKMYDRFLNWLSNQLGIKITSHIFRHTFGMRMSRLGMDMKDIASMMGHSSSITTENYYVMPKEEDIVKRVMERIT